MKHIPYTKTILCTKYSNTSCTAENCKSNSHLCIKQKK